MTEHAIPRYEKRIDKDLIFYYMERDVAGVRLGVSVAVTHPEHKYGRAVVAKRLLRARAGLRHTFTQAVLAVESELA